MNALNVFLYGILPYIVAAVFVGGAIWRHKYDRFGWTTRSSEVYERKLLKIGSPLFHWGILLVIGGHIVGLLIPASWLYAIGVNEHMYHIGATVLGTGAAIMVVVGLVVLIYRRRTTRSVFLSTTRMDKLMFLLLGLSIASGTWATVQEQIVAGGYDYRETISPWFRSLFIFQPDVELMSGVPLAFGIHVLAALVLFAVWPFTRLVHVFSAPIQYFFRPYIVYRARDPRRDPTARPGWIPAGLIYPTSPEPTSSSIGEIGTSSRD